MSQQNENLRTSDVILEGPKAQNLSMFPRTVVPKILEERGEKFISNQIKTTKYNIFNFLPLTILQQFLNVTKVFYLINVILQYQPTIATNSPLASLVPLCFVVFIGILKEFLADIKRWKEDRKANNVFFEKIQSRESWNSNLISVKSNELKVGDVIQLQDEQIVPADCIILYSNNEDSGECFIQTAQLDGERNLKVKMSVRYLQKNFFELLRSSQTLIEAHLEAPKKDLYHLHGQINIYHNKESKDACIRKVLDIKNFLPRGSMIKNTGKVYGLIVYTGKETKIMLNSGKYSVKKSKLDHQINILIACNILLLLILDLIMCVLNYKFASANVEKMVYIWSPESVQSVGVHTTVWKGTKKVIASFYLLFNQFVPVSLIVILELAKLHYTSYIEDDADMVVEDFLIKDYRGCSVQNLSIHEDLGNIDYIFSDKTGTLTQNSLSFKALSINGNIWEGEPIKLRLSSYLTNLTENEYNYSLFQRFWKCASLCHDIIIFRQNGVSHYSGSSQDEIVVLDAGKTSKFCSLINRDSESMTIIQDNGEEEEYQILKIQEFSSERKRMSILLREKSTNKVFSFVKGADMMIFPRIRDQDLIDQAAKDASYLSRKGYRTLCYAMKEMNINADSKEEIDELTEEEMESNLELLGITGVEDELQEGVIQCLEDFRDAGINVWMLTGDKGETALEIGYSCGLFIRKNFTVFKIEEVEDDLKVVMEKIIRNRAGLKNYGLMVAGNQIPFLISNKELQSQFFEIVKLSKSVIAYRLSPSQKADIVKFVRRNAKKSMALCIGDGANDVNMIQQANVGVGLFGKEGNQAASFADFAVPKFMHLRRLMFWHGRSFGTNSTLYVKLYMFKSAAYSFVLMLYNLQNGKSAFAIYDDLYQSTYKVVHVILAVYFFLVCDQKLSFAFTGRESELSFKLSQYYSHCKKKYLGNVINDFFVWVFLSLISASFIYFLNQYMYGEMISSTGQTEGVWTMGHTITWALVVLNHGVIMLMTKNYTWYIVIPYIISFTFFFPLSILVLQNNDKQDINGASMSYVILYEIMKLPQFWLSLFLTSATNLLALQFYKAYESLFLYPQFEQIPFLRKSERNQFRPSILQNQEV